jgi:hypothetical protein
MIVKDSNDLLNFLVSQSDSSKNWFGFQQQRITAISLAHEIAKNYADKLTPDEVVDYAIAINESIYHKIIKATR